MLKVNEIFCSIQGESTFAGLPCVFVRLTGCNLRCSFCDTKYAYFEGTDFSINEIIKRVNLFDCNLVEITGGEPLLQKKSVELANQLLREGKQVLVETNGSLDISALNKPIIRILDIKCPGSGESEKTYWKNIPNLHSNDNVKFVITNHKDFYWATGVVKKYDLIKKANVLFSPAFNILDAKKLSKWILDLGLPIRVQLQLHKYIWQPTKRGV
jgi:7-carboxy-7-deazaguanine synthase